MSVLAHTIQISNGNFNLKHNFHLKNLFNNKIVLSYSWVYSVSKISTEIKRISCLNIYNQYLQRILIIYKYRYVPQHIIYIQNNIYYRYNSYFIGRKVHLINISHTVIKTYLLRNNDKNTDNCAAVSAKCYDIIWMKCEHFNDTNYFSVPISK